MVVLLGMILVLGGFSLTGQPGTGTDSGAPIVINAGAGGGANGGNVNIGGGNDSQVGGNVSLSAGSGTLNQGGAASIDGGNGLTGGAVNVVAGTGTDWEWWDYNLKQGGVQQELRGMLY